MRTKKILIEFEKQYRQGELLKMCDLKNFLEEALDEYALSIIPPKYEDNKERPLSVFETTFNMVVDQMREKVNGK